MVRVPTALERSVDGLGRVFHAFFTIKDVGTGTGQVPAIAHNVVVGGHSGTLKFATDGGRGTTSWGFAHHSLQGGGFVKRLEVGYSGRGPAEAPCCKQAAAARFGWHRRTGACIPPGAKSSTAVPASQANLPISTRICLAVAQAAAR